MATMTHHLAQQDAQAAYAAWNERRRELIARVAGELAELMLEDYDHQTGPRGVAERFAWRETRTHAEVTMGEVRADAEMIVVNRLAERRREGR